MTATDLVMPVTGEVLDLANLTSAQLVDVRAGIANLSSELAAAKTQVNLEITKRIDQENREGGTGYTWRINGYKITVPSPAAAGKLHADALRAELAAQHRELDVDALFQPKITYTLRIDRWRNLLKQRPELDDLRKRHTSPAARTVTITPLPQLRPLPAIDATTEDE